MAVGGILNAAIVLVVCRYAAVEVGEAPVVVTMHSTATFVVAGITASLLLAHAGSTGRRGYLLLGATYATLAGIMAAFPFAFNGALGPEGSLVGGQQSAVSLFYWWHLVVVVGVTTSAALLARDQREHRRPSRRSGVVPTLLGVACLLALVIALSTRQRPPWPALLAPGGELTGLARFLDAALVVASAVCLVVTVLGARQRSYIGTWLAVMGMLILGDSIVNEVTPARYTVGWYYNRGFGLLISASLLVALVVHLSRVDRANAKLAATDLLTGTGSRAELVAALQREMSRAKSNGERLALLWVDLDGFKAVNDALGHSVGDEVLKAVASRLRAQVRSQDLVARLGGDEFGVLLTDDADGTRAAAVAERMLASVREPVDLGFTTALVTASVGIAVAPDDASDPDALLHRADQAMYSAKQPGGDRHNRFVSGIGVDVQHRAELRRQLAQALLRHELDLDYQPIVDPIDGDLKGVEALVRWVRDDTRVPAGSFIGLAETTGQICAIGMQVVEILERQLDDLLSAMGDEAFVSFNVSSTELADPRTVDRLLSPRLIERAERLVVEVTEGVDMGRGGEAQRGLSRLREAGMRVAIDDFGAGFSNFMRLSELSPSLLKVDRSIVVRAAGGRASDVAFLTSVVGVANAVGCVVVAEGVETDDEAEVVIRLGVPLAQGFRWGRPVPAGEIAALGRRRTIEEARPASSKSAL
jgi:diguanylate cyclase (GGDEF)-like protein